MHRISRRFEFDAGHRVWGHEGKCRYLHGHRYSVILTVQSVELDSLGRVIDFSAIKGIVGSWIDENLDHNFLSHPSDPILELSSFWKNPEKRPFVMPNGNPTAENIAEMLYRKSVELLEGRPFFVVKVRVYETPNCYAEFRGIGA